MHVETLGHPSAGLSLMHAEQSINSRRLEATLVLPALDGSIYSGYAIEEVRGGFWEAG